MSDTSRETRTPAPRAGGNRRLGAFAVPAVLVVPAALAAGAPAAGSPEPEEPDRWTPALSMRYHRVSGTAVSPDGSLAAFVVTEPLMEGEQSEYRSRIRVVPTAGGETVTYTRDTESASAPAFSPDGAYLGFLSSRGDGEQQVWLLPLAGGEARPLTRAEAGVRSFRFSPDGRSVAYTMTDPETEEEKKRKKEKRDVELVDRNFRYVHIYAALVTDAPDPDGEDRRLTGGDFSVTGFDWSSSDRIVFAHQPDPRINTNRRAGDLSVVHLADGAVRLLHGGGGVESSPVVSPDGATVAFRSTGDRVEPVGLGDVYRMPVMGGERTRLAETPDRSPGILGWARDGSFVYVAEAHRTSRRVFALPADGGAPVALTPGGGVFRSAAVAREADVMAFVHETPDTPWEVFAADLAPGGGPAPSFEMRRLTDLHSGVPRPAMGPTSLRTWSAPDGMEIEGLLTLPADHRPGAPAPLILNVHGGPAGVYSETFTGGPSIYMLQYFAQEGFAVLRPNPRGSTGYGKEFRYANVMEWGFSDLDDLLAGVDLLVEEGVADPDRLFLMGWSYGGYITSFAVTRTDRFRAASMGAGLPNLISMVTTTDIQDYLAAHMGGDYWEDYEMYEGHSAIYRIAEVSTPTQVIHGAEDLRVPFTQGQEFYRALDRRGVPTEMVVYPRTPHGPREPKFLMDVSERILAWFRAHDAGAEGGETTAPPPD